MNKGKYGKSNAAKSILTTSKAFKGKSDGDGKSTKAKVFKGDGKALKSKSTLSGAQSIMGKEHADTDDTNSEYSKQSSTDYDAMNENAAEQESSIVS